MDFKKLIPVLAVLGVLAYGGLKIRNHLKGLVEKPAQVTAVNPALVKKSLGEYVRQPRAEYKKIVEANPQIPKACANYFGQIEALDFGPNSQVQYQMIPSPDTECVIADESYLLAEKDFLQKCVLTNPNKSDVVNEECGSALFLLRASMTRVLLKDKAITEIKDLKQLTDLLFAEFVGKFDDSHAPDFNRINAVANQMLQQNPNLYVAAKVSAFTSLMQGLERNDSAVWSQADAALQRAQHLNPNDSNLSDTEAAIRTHGFEAQKTIDYANGMLQKNPSDDRGLFFLAYGQWKSGDRNNSVQSLQRAIELNPNRPDYRAVMGEITKPNAGVDAFKGSLSVVVSNDDFNL